LVPHREAGMAESVLPPEYQRIWAAVRQAGAPVATRAVGEELGLIDLPGSTRALGDHQLFHTPGALMPGYADHQGPAAGSFTNARRVHGSTVKLPVWHRDQDRYLADAYTTAIIKVAEHHKELVK
ncbi:hypothetical protein ABZ698_41520, partial [Streptomyces antibioticus]